MIEQTTMSSTNMTNDDASSSHWQSIGDADAAFDAQAMRVFMHMMVLSGGVFIAAFLQVYIIIECIVSLSFHLQRLTWEMSGIRQVFRIKKAYISKLLHMDVAWLESRHSGQVAGMLHE